MIQGIQGSPGKRFQIKSYVVGFSYVGQGLQILHRQLPHFRNAPVESVAHALTCGASRSSIVNCIAAARENARQVRELAGSAMWEQLNRLFRSVHGPAGEDQ